VSRGGAYDQVSEVKTNDETRLRSTQMEEVRIFEVQFLEAETQTTI
jgi:hypothetical protein